MALDQAVIAVFGPPPANVNLDDSQVAQDNAAVISLLAIATVTVILRFIARFSMKQPFKTDDCLIIVSLLFVCATTGLSIAGGTFGAGKHVWSITLPGLTNIFKILLTYTFAYAGACAACKASILFFYRRVFVIAQQDPQGLDEIGLTSQVTSSLQTQKPHSIESASHDNVHVQSIVLQSDFLQSVFNREASRR